MAKYLFVNQGTSWQCTKKGSSRSSPHCGLLYCILWTLAIASWQTRTIWQLIPLLANSKIMNCLQNSAWGDNGKNDYLYWGKKWLYRPKPFWQFWREIHSQWWEKISFLDLAKFSYCDDTRLTLKFIFTVFRSTDGIWISWSLARDR